jgi:hypothetical protein
MTPDTKSDEQLAAAADTGLRGQGAVVEMMSRLKSALADSEASTRRLNCILIWLTGILVVLTGILVWLTILLVIRR